MSTATSLKLILPRRPLADRFGTAANVTPTRTPKPVLQNVLLTVTEGQVRSEEHTSELQSQR